MIPDSLISCGYLLLGCGCCVNRLMNHSTGTFSKLLPEFVIASVGIAAIGARSLHALIYNLFWRSYPIDPRLIAKELQNVQHDKNFVDCMLGRCGVAALVYSFYYHYEFFGTGMFFVIGLTAAEAFLVEEEISIARQIRGPQRVSSIMQKLPYSLDTIWIVFNELFGWAVGNNYYRLANVPYSLTVWALPPQGFYQGWSIKHSINDYAMLCYIILLTEGLCA